MTGQTPDISGYHAHIYYDATSKQTATAVREGLAAAFPESTLGSWHDEPVGPHPMGSYLIAFGPERFADVVTWLTLNRQGLIVFVHPESGDDLADHTERAIWMGGMPDLDLSLFGDSGETSDDF